MKVFTGTVIRVSDKTAKVAVTRVVAHPIYKKRIKRTKNFLVHDEVGVLVGAQVRFIDSKPYSKLKRWKIVENAGARKDKKLSKVKAVSKEDSRGSIADKRSVKSVVSKKVVSKKGVTQTKKVVKAKK